MKLETIKRNNKKRIIIGSMIVLSVVGCLTLTTTRAKYRSIQSIKLAKGTIDYKAPDLKLAIKVSEDGINYTNQKEIPENNYTLNTERSKCRIPTSTLNGENAPVDNSITIEYVDGKLNFLGLTKNDTKCYIYLDKKVTTPSEDTIVKLNVKNIKSGTPDFSVIATEAETEDNNGIYMTDDPMYGENAKTYYWRGATTTNHVIFDNKCWRIVRINGDGSIRLIYNGTPSETACPGNGTNSNSVVLSGTAYNSTNNNSKYVGWTYATTNMQRPSVDVPQTNGIASTIKEELENWYNEDTNISATSKNKMVEGKFCNDRNTENNEPWRATGLSAQHYATFQRLTEITPSLSCSDGDIYKLEVGIITTDEVIYAGGKSGIKNASYYLYNGLNYWTMSPAFWGDGNGYAQVYNINDNGFLSWKPVTDLNYSVRPVINLRSDVTFNPGSDGTQNNPYIVQ